MILYIDTSALVKLYLDEPGHALVMEAVARTTLIATTLLTYAETRAAFAKATRMGKLARSVEPWITASFIQDWAHLQIIEVDSNLVMAAGELASHHGLRGYDAVHLASALRLAGTGLTVTFASFDLRLTSAAMAEGLLTDLTMPGEDEHSSAGA